MTAQSTTDVLIIGGGLAGASVAYSLAKRGICSTILERRPHVAEGASGNRFGLLMPYLTATQSPHAALYGAGFRFSHQLLSHELQDESALFRNCGGLQLSTSARLQKLIAEHTPLLAPCSITPVSAQEASDISNTMLSDSGFFVPDGGYVSPPALVTTLLSRCSPYLSVLCGAEARSITQRSTDWEVTTSQGATYTASRVVICSAYEATTLEICSWLPLEAIRGQTIIARCSSRSEALRTLISYDGYITPAESGTHLIGALYRHGDLSTTPALEDSAEIMRRLARRCSTLRLTADDIQSARACFRTSTFDRLPYIGLLPHFELMRSQARAYQSGSDIKRLIGLSELPGIFVSLGHGSRGLLSCPLGGELIAAHIAATDLTGLHDAAQVVDPARFAYRALT